MEYRNSRLVLGKEVEIPKYLWSALLGQGQNYRLLFCALLSCRCRGVSSALI